MLRLMPVLTIVVKNNTIFAKFLTAHGAGKQGLHLVGIEMFFLVGGLVEGHAASLDRALVWLLPRVDTEVVEQVVPLFEDHVALVVVLIADESALRSARVVVHELD